jgi:hypothetical protein
LVFLSSPPSASRASDAVRSGSEARRDAFLFNSLVVVFKRRQPEHVHGALLRGRRQGDSPVWRFRPERDLPHDGALDASSERFR